MRANAFEVVDTCVRCAWRSERFFCNLSPAAFKSFENVSFTSVYPQGAILYAEAQPARGIFLLCKGSAKLSIASADGKTLISHIAREGEVLGLDSTFTGNPYKSTAETLEPTQVNFVRREDFLRFVSEFRDACVQAARQLSGECEANADHIRALGLSHTAAEKLAHLILSWCAQYGKEAENGTRIQMLMTHESIAELLGTSRETVTRLLKDFRDKRIIAVRGSALTLLNKPALEALVLL